MAIAKPVVAIAGATGLVGKEITEILLQRKFPYSELRLLASKNSAGELYEVGGESVEVKELKEDSFAGVNIAFFATSADLSAKFIPIAVKAGAFCIDKSSKYRTDPNVPLMIPEVNIDLLSADTKIIASPNCSTIQLVPVLAKIHEAAGLKRVVVSTYQAVSGAGRDAMDELWEQVQAIYTQQEIEIEAFQHQIAFNCIPQIDTFMENGYTKEEYKLIDESRKILRLPNLKITATAVRVPVFNAHAESVNVETERELSPEGLIKILESAAGIKVIPNHNEYPMQIDASGQDDIFVGRIRRDDSVTNGLNFWVVADNLRKGAALNAVQVAEKILSLP